MNALVPFLGMYHYVIENNLIKEIGAEVSTWGSRDDRGGRIVRMSMAECRERRLSTVSVKYKETNTHLYGLKVSRSPC